MFTIPNKLWKAILYFFYLLIFFLLFLFCEKSPSPLLSGQVRLTAEEVGVTEVWLGVQTAHIIGEFSLKVWRDDTCIFRGVFSGADTTVYDSRLRPAHRYRYRARLERNGHPVLESAPLEITTMDTTSHEFTWEIIEIPSPYGSGVLYDVAIIDENDIWAVGEIYADSIQPWLPYNAVHWDGQRWELRRIPYYYRGSVWYLPLKSIIAFSKNDIWFEAGIHWNGNEFETRSLNIEFPSHVNKMWGTSSDNFYIVGNNGLIAHYDGSRWQKIESGTELPIKDIWGVVDWKTGKENILAVACNLFSNEGIAVLQITENSVHETSTTNLPVNISSVWSDDGREWYICGNSLYKTRNLNQPWKPVSGLPPIFQQQVRGKGPNNIFIVGNFGLVLHWNGFNWRYYSAFQGILLGLAIKDNLVVAVGSKLDGIVADSGIILVGRSN